MPAIVPFSKRVNRKHAFHNLALTGFVEHARHAIALDERRAVFPSMPWGDLTEINRFPGGHGSVGGGGDIRGLSDGALAWITRGAKDAGLVLDKDKGSRIHGFHPEPLSALDNMSMPHHDATYAILTDRMGPGRVCEVSMSATRRWHVPAESLPERKPYRPPTLSQLASQLDAIELGGIRSGATPLQGRIEAC